MSRSRWGAAAACSLLVLSGCGSDDPGPNLTVSGTISICPEDGAGCADLPAAGATVRVFDESGAQVREASLGADGETEFAVPAGGYSASIEMPSLGLETKAGKGAQVVLSEDGAGELSLLLPAVTMAPRQQPGA